MSIFLPALAVSFAAFCVWLGVRIANRRERWAKRTAIGLAASLPILYLVSFGPSCWYLSQEMFDVEIDSVKHVVRRAPAFYWPVGRIAWHGPRFLALGLNWYVMLGFGPNTEVHLSTGADDNSEVVFR